MNLRGKRIVAVAVLICFFSCKKDNSNPALAALAGTWSFNGIHAKTSSSAMDVEGGIQYTTVTTSEYLTTLNAGTIRISGNTMTGTGITYAATINSLVTDYEGTSIIDSFSTSMPVNLPPTNSTSTFEVIGTDSIHYTSPGLPGTGGSGTPATGSKFSIEGDILTLTSYVVQDKVFDTLGVAITQHEAAFVVTTLKKQ
jgi:hypothetical protein